MKNEIKSEIFIPKYSNTVYTLEVDFGKVKPLLIEQMVNCFENDKLRNGDYTDYSMDFAQHINELVCLMNDGKVYKVLDCIAGYGEGLPKEYDLAHAIINRHMRTL